MRAETDGGSAQNGQPGQTQQRDEGLFRISLLLHVLDGRAAFGLRQISFEAEVAKAKRRAVLKGSRQYLDHDTFKAIAGAIAGALAQ